MAKGKKRRRRRSRMITRCVLLGALALIALFYYRPIRSYVKTKDEVAQRAAEVHKLAVEHRRLQHRLANSGTQAELIRQARQLGWVRPGEKLFIVKGIERWRHEKQKPKQP